MPEPNALERRNPLPPGRYWVTVDPINFEAFNEWKGSSSRIRLEATEAHRDDPKPFEFHVFRILAPGLVVWPEQLGPPSIAAEDVQQFTDVISAPVIDDADPKALSDKLIDLGKLALFAAGLVALAKIFGRK